MKLFREVVKDTTDQVLYFYSSGHFRIRIVMYMGDGEISCKVEIVNIQSLSQWTDLGWLYPNDIKGRKTKKAYVQRALELAIQFIDGE